MTDVEFRKLVSEMRHNQREYFRTKSQGSFQEAKRLERLVDKMLMHDPQMQLFEERGDD